MEEEKLLDANLKAEIAIKALKGEKTIEEIALEHGISKAQVRKFKRQLQENSSDLFSKEVDPQQENGDKKKNPDEEGQHKKIGLRTIVNKTVNLLKRDNINVIGTLILAIFTGILAVYTVRMAHYTEKMSHHSAKTAKYTSDMANYTDDMARSTKDLVDISKNPILHIYCLIESDFEYTINDGIQFKSGDYLDKRKKAKFYIAVSNKWESNIKAKMSIKFGISVLSQDKFKFTLKSKIYNIDDFPIALGPSDISDITEVKEIQDKLLGKDFNWRSTHFDKIIKFKIYKHLVEVPHYPYAGIDVKYFGFDEFKALHDQFKKRKSKEI